MKKNKANFAYVAIAYIIIIVFIFAIIWGINQKLNNDSKNKKFQTYMNNIVNYSAFFQENNVSPILFHENGKNYLKIIFESGAEAIYGPNLIRVNNNIKWVNYSKTYVVNVEIYDIGKDKKTAQVSTNYDGGYGTRVCYYLPDFFDIKPDWGDYLKADLDVKKIITKEELNKMYSEAVQMEQLIKEQYLHCQDEMK